MDNIEKYLGEATPPGATGGLSPQARKLIDNANKAMTSLIDTFKNDIKRTEYGQKAKLDDIEKKLQSELKQVEIKWNDIGWMIVKVARAISTGKI